MYKESRIIFWFYAAFVLNLLKTYRGQRCTINFAEKGLLKIGCRFYRKKRTIGDYLYLKLRHVVLENSADH